MGQRERNDGLTEMKMPITRVPAIVFSCPEHIEGLVYPMKR